MNNLIFDEVIENIYVDPLWYCCKTKTWRYNSSCHMFIDFGKDIKQLHAFARDINLDRIWFHYSKSKVPHYDLSPKRREIAIKNGAIELSRKEAALIFRKYKKC